MTAPDDFAALRAALDALNAECAKLAGDIRRPPETAEISAHLAFMRECKPDVIGRLLSAEEERDRLRILNNIRNHRLISERARAERMAADARRYQWIRDRHETYGDAAEIVWTIPGKRWDAAIDAALAAEEPPNLPTQEGVDAVMRACKDAIAEEPKHE